MRQIITSDKNITFIDVDGKTKVVPMNQVWYHINEDTITFLLIERYDSEGICLFTTLAEDLQINGSTYTIEQLKNGQGINSMFSPTGLIIKLVDELPASGDDSTIYLMANDKGSYTEYFWIKEKNKWEELGDLTKIDLTNYFTKDEINLMFANVYTKDEVDALFNDVYSKNEIDDALVLKADVDDVYTKTEVDTALERKQNILTAGENITIENNVISATGGGSTEETDPVFTAWENSSKIVAGKNAFTTSSNTIVIGEGANSSSSNCIAIGTNAFSGGNNSNVAIGTNAYAWNGVAIGTGSKASAGGIAIGGSIANTGISIGRSNRGDNSGNLPKNDILIGEFNYSQRDNSIVIGKYNDTNNTNLYANGIILIGMSHLPTNYNEILLGSYTKSISGADGTHFAISSYDSSNSNRKNCFEIRNNNDVYIWNADHTEMIKLQDYMGGGGSEPTYDADNEELIF